MKKLLTLTLLTAAIATSTNALANDEHQIGVQLHSGSAKYKSSSKDGDGVSNLYLYYNYQFDPMFSLEGGLSVGAELDDWDCTDLTKDRFECVRENNALFDLNANKLEYTSIVVAGKAQFDVTQNSNVYGKLGLHRYDYEMKNGNTKVVDDSGFGYLAEAGWEYQWNNGIGLNLAVRYTDMGDLDTTTWGVGMSYRF
ncbi:porin family protein [Pseudoalteromonas xiamenensis]|uniref:porin family protein n=1 Tax=Pseudoalteromonas xiamenensis TaxID=882626 RepID=UPI0027E5044F|nr:porin family protein [Pseudoalteromonas xiamenensis]WMN60509.1 porin family protein [Pseudoalteromonas xiamenensis]